MKRNGLVCSRRAALGLISVAALGTVTPVAASGRTVQMYRTTGCSCCLVWARHLEVAGFTVMVEEAASAVLMRMKREAGLKPEHNSCHTAQVGGYTIEGHVPAREILRVLAESPEASGLVVPGMPIGSPGMESGNRQQGYDVLLFRRDGSTAIFASYPASDRPER